MKLQIETVFRDKNGDFCASNVWAVVIDSRAPL